ncbi:MAG: response regulator transcription factor [Acidobacteria bacterium]|nr:response regulator transcription factor [Acidobacteriota bacterium]
MIRFLVVDDEPLSRQLVMNYARQVPELRGVAACDHATDAIEILNNQVVDLMFLDIELPQLGGFEMLRSLAAPPEVIVTTAHRDYAWEGYELNVLDYLLKPFSFERFLKAVQKSRRWAIESPTSLFVKDGRRLHQVHHDELLRVESAGNYCIMYLKNCKLMCHETLSHLEQVLPDSFIRIHKSHLVALDAISWVESGCVGVSGHSIPIGRTYRKKLDQRLQLPPNETS